MKKVIYLLLCSFIYCTTGFANTKIPIITASEGGSGPDTSFPDEDCNISIIYNQLATIMVANLVPQTNGTGYTLPANAPDLYLQLYAHDGNGAPSIHRKNITNFDWELVGFFGTTTANIYQANVNLWTYLETICPIPEETGASLELVTYDELLGVYVPYPVCDHSGVNELFPCTVFEGLSCNNKLCISGNINRVDGLSPNPFDCSDCEPGPNKFFPGNGSSSFRSNGVEELRAETFACSVVSNPFTDQLSINWENGGREPMQLQVFGVTGQLLETLTVEGPMGNDVIDSANWPKGIYFLMATQGEQRETIKLIKN